MSGIQKLIMRILVGAADNNIKFKELCNLLERLGFERRTKGSHNVFKKTGIKTLINLQKDGELAKPYQIKQVRKLLIENNLIGDIDVQL